MTVFFLASLRRMVLLCDEMMPRHSAYNYNFVSMYMFRLNILFSEWFLGKDSSIALRKLCPISVLTFELKGAIGLYQVILRLLWRGFFVRVVDRSVSFSCSRSFSKLLDMGECLRRTIACRMKFSRGVG